MKVKVTYWEDIIDCVDEKTFDVSSFEELNYVAREYANEVVVGEKGCVDLAGWDYHKVDDSGVVFPLPV